MLGVDLLRPLPARRGDAARLAGQRRAGAHRSVGAGQRPRRVRERADRRALRLEAGCDRARAGRRPRGAAARRGDRPARREPASTRASCSSTSRPHRSSSAKSGCSTGSTSRSIRPAGRGAAAARRRHPARRAGDPAEGAHRRDLAHAAELSAEPLGARVRRAARRDVPDLQHGRDLGRAAARRDRYGARAGRDPGRDLPHVSSARARCSAWSARCSASGWARCWRRSRSRRSRARSTRSTSPRMPTASSTTRCCSSRRSCWASRPRSPRPRSRHSTRRARRPRSRCARRATSGACRGSRRARRFSAWAACCSPTAARASRAFDGVPVFGYAAGLLIIFGGSLCAPLAVGALARAGTSLAARRPTGTGRGQPRRLAAAHRGRGRLADDRDRDDGFGRDSDRLVPHDRRRLGGRYAQRRPLRAPARASPTPRPTRVSRRSVAAHIAALPGVAAVDMFRAISMPFRGRLTNLGATDLRGAGRRATTCGCSTAPTRSRSRHLARYHQRAGLRAVRDASSASARATRSTRRRLPGRRRSRWRAVYNDYSSDAGVVMLDVRTFRRLFRDDSVNSIAIYARPGTDLTALADGGAARGRAAADRCGDQPRAARPRRHDLRPDVRDYVRAVRHRDHDRRAGGGVDLVRAGAGAAAGVRALALSWA